MISDSLPDRSDTLLVLDDALPIRRDAVPILGDDVLIRDDAPDASSPSTTAKLEGHFV